LNKFSGGCVRMMKIVNASMFEEFSEEKIKGNILEIHELLKEKSQ
jgi:hypothetical protein